MKSLSSCIRTLSLVQLSLLLLVLAGCRGSQVISSAEQNASREDNLPTASYAIPKALLKLDIELTYPQVGPAAARAPANSAETMIPKVTVEYVPVRIVNVFHDPSSFSLDNISIEVDQSSFLKKVATATDSQTDDFIKDAVSLLTTGLRVGAALPAGTLTVREGAVSQSISRYLDPYANNANALALTAGNDPIVVSVSDTVANAVGVVSLPASTGADPVCNNICYPALITKIITIKWRGHEDELRVVIPDPKQLVELDFSRASFVKKTITANFDKGILSSIAVDKPSEAMALAKVPLDILTALVKLPAELIQLKIDTTKKETGELEEQKKLLEAQQALIKAIQEAKAGGSADAPPDD